MNETPKRGRPNGAKELAETLRNAARRAIRGLEEDGTPLSEILKNAIKERPLLAIKALSTLVPKQLEVEHRDRDPFAEMSDDELDAFVANARVLLAGRETAEGTQGAEVPSSLH